MRYIVEICCYCVAVMFGAVGLIFMSTKAIMMGFVFALVGSLILAIKFFVEWSKDQAKDSCSFNTKRRYEPRINR